MSFDNRVLWFIVLLLFVNLICGVNMPAWFRWQVHTSGRYVFMCDYHTGELHYPILFEDQYQIVTMRSYRTFNKWCPDLMGPY